MHGGINSLAECQHPYGNELCAWIPQSQDNTQLGSRERLRNKMVKLREDAAERVENAELRAAKARRIENQKKTKPREKAVLDNCVDYCCPQ